MQIRTFHSILDRRNEASAYILGFWVADGNICLSTSKSRSRKQKVFAITNTDYQIMNDMAELFKKNLIKRPGRTLREKEFFVLRVKSDRLFDICYELSKSTNKTTGTILEPSIPKTHFNHFVRGFFDGDGSIFIKRYQNRHNKITEALTTNFSSGNQTNVLDVILKMIQSRVPELNGKARSGKTCRQVVFGQYDSMLLCEWMYRGATVYMKRKKDIWDSADKERLARSKKFRAKPKG